MLVRSRRAVALAIGAALVAFATACTNPTAPSSTTSRDGVIIGGSGGATTPQAPDGVIIGGSG